MWYKEFKADWLKPLNSKMAVQYICYKDAVHSSQRTHFASIRKNSLLMLYREILGM